MTKSALANRHPKKWQAAAARCETIQLDTLVPQDEFDTSVLSRLIVIEGERDFSEGVSGPLRLGGRGGDDFRITASVHLHKSKVPHYHITVRGSVPRSKKGVTPERQWPTLETFFETIADGLEDPDEVDTYILTQHRYPRGWWKGAMELPVPLPSRPGEKQADAELTGLEVSYRGESGTERVLLTTSNEDFRVIISFVHSGSMRGDLFSKTLRRATVIGGRLFDQGTHQTEDEDE